MSWFFIRPRHMCSPARCAKGLLHPARQRSARVRVLETRVEEHVARHIAVVYCGGTVNCAREDVEMPRP